MASRLGVSQEAIARLRAYTPPDSLVYPRLPLSRRAAVLILLYADQAGELQVILTLRSSKLRSHAGQVALPGGRADSITETAFETARREASEEIGLPLPTLPPPFTLEHLCELPAYLSVNELGVRPCVAYATAQASSDDSSSPDDSAKRPINVVPQDILLPKISADEVEAVFTAPLWRFSSALNTDGTESEITYSGEWKTWADRRWRMHRFSVPGTACVGRKAPLNADHALEQAMERKDPPSDPPFEVWGLTARILVDAARIAYGREPDFEANPDMGEELIMLRLMEHGKLLDEYVSSRAKQTRDPKLS